MDQLSRSQRMIVVTIAAILAVAFAIAFIYFAAFADRHPRVKHDILFAVLTVGSLLVAWFAWPGAASTREG